MSATNLNNLNKTKLIEIINNLREENSALKEMALVMTQTYERLIKLEREQNLNLQYYVYFIKSHLLLLCLYEFQPIIQIFIHMNHSNIWVWLFSVIVSYFSPWKSTFWIPCKCKIWFYVCYSLTRAMMLWKYNSLFNFVTFLLRPSDISLFPTSHCGVLKSSSFSLNETPLSYDRWWVSDVY